MKKYIITSLIILCANIVTAQDSCHLKAVITSDKMELTCKGKTTTLNAVTTITINQLSVVMEINMMGYLKHSYFMITKSDSCRKTETGFENTYQIEELPQGDEEITNGRSILKISKSQDSYTFDITGLKKNECSTKFIVTSYKSAE